MGGINTIKFNTENKIMINEKCVFGTVNPVYCKCAVSCCHSFVFQSEDSVEFFADTGHWLLSKGIDCINNICVMQKSLLNEQNHEEQKEL